MAYWNNFCNNFNYVSATGNIIWYEKINVNICSKRKDDKNRFRGHTIDASYIEWYQPLRYGLIMYVI